MDILIVILFSYLSGSIPFGYLITKIFIKTDIRKIGSGNIGATNVLRSGSKYLAGLTLALDVLKGYLPVIFCINFFPDYIMLGSLSVFLGHIFPIWLNFKGGKGVATYLGVIIALSIQLSFLFMFTWLVVSLIFKYSSVSSMFAALTVFIINFIRENVTSIGALTINSETQDSKLLFIFFILIIYTHRKNISNLKNKTESKIKI